MVLALCLDDIFKINLLFFAGKGKKLYTYLE
jgi:hypothetical protein